MYNPVLAVYNPWVIHTAPKSQPNFPGHIFRCAVSYGGLLACTAPNQPCTNAFGQFGIELTHSKEYGEILDPLLTDTGCD